MPDIKIRARRTDDIAHIDLLIDHPMESGQRRDNSGVRIPAWHLTSVQVFHKESNVAEFELGPLVSKNPVLSLLIRRTETGDVVKVVWKDNRGESGERQKTLA